jgi:hypothetical protein
MPRKSKIDELRDRFEAALQKGLESESAVERTAAIKATADMLNPNLTDLQKQAKKAEEDREAAESALKTAQTALDAANAELGPLREQAAKFVTMETEYVDLKTNFDARIAAMRDELVAEAQRHSWDAQRAENSATEKLREADNKVSASGWTELRKTLAELIARHGIPQPDFWATSATMPAAFWQLWGWSDTKARIYTAYKSGYKQPTEAFKSHAYRILTEGLPIFPMLIQQTENGPQPIYPEREQKGIADLGVRTECIREMCQRFNCWEEIQSRVDERQAAELGQHLRNTANSLQVQEQDLSRRGYGRSPVAVQPESATNFTGECIDPANCCCPKHNGTPARFRNSLDGVEETA